MGDTQVMELDFTQDLQDDFKEGTSKGSSLVGWLEIETECYELHEGITKLGRDSSLCKIVLSGQKTLSKEHAKFDASRNFITLCDMGSRNKTRIGKMTLKPHVQYALHGGESLKFGAVLAKFILSQMVEDSDSDAPSESMLESKSSRKNIDDSDEDIISPTPQVSSDLKPNKNRRRSSDFVPETPLVTSCSIGDGQMSVVQESPLTQSTPQHSARSKADHWKLCASGFFSPIDQSISISLVEPPDSSISEEAVNKSREVIMEGSTSNAKSPPKQQEEDYNSDESTDIEDFFGDESKEEATKGTSETQDVLAAFASATQHVSDDSISELQTQSYDRTDSGTIFKRPMVKAKTQNSSLSSVSAVCDVQTQQFQYPDFKNTDVEESCQSSEDEDIFNMPTQLFSYDQLRSSRGPKKVSDKSIFEAPTQLCEASAQVCEVSSQVCEAQTQVFDKSAQICEAPSEAFEVSSKVLESITQALETPTQAFGAPTQTVEAPTQVFEAPTQVFEAPTQIFEAPTQVFEVPTQIFEASTKSFEASVHTSATSLASSSNSKVLNKEMLAHKDHKVMKLIPNKTEKKCSKDDKLDDTDFDFSKTLTDAIEDQGVVETQIFSWSQVKSAEEDKNMEQDEHDVSLNTNYKEEDVCDSDSQSSASETILQELSGQEVNNFEAQEPKGKGEQEKMEKDLSDIHTNERDDSSFNYDGIPPMLTEETSGKVKDPHNLSDYNSDESTDIEDEALTRGSNATSASSIVLTDAKKQQSNEAVETGRNDVHISAAEEDAEPADMPQQHLSGYSTDESTDIEDNVVMIVKSDSESLHKENYFSKNDTDTSLKLELTFSSDLSLTFDGDKKVLKTPSTDLTKDGPKQTIKLNQSSETSGTECSPSKNSESSEIVHSVDLSKHSPKASRPPVETITNSGDKIVKLLKDAESPQQKNEIINSKNSHYQSILNRSQALFDLPEDGADVEYCPEVTEAKEEASNLSHDSEDCTIVQSPVAESHHLKNAERKSTNVPVMQQKNCYFSSWIEMQESPIRMTKYGRRSKVPARYSPSKLQTTSLPELLSRVDNLAVSSSAEELETSVEPEGHTLQSTTLTAKVLHGKDEKHFSRNPQFSETQNKLSTVEECKTGDVATPNLISGGASKGSIIINENQINAKTLKPHETKTQNYNLLKRKLDLSESDNEGKEESKPVSYLTPNSSMKMKGTNKRNAENIAEESNRAEVLSPLKMPKADDVNEDIAEQAVINPLKRKRKEISESEVQKNETRNCLQYDQSNINNHKMDTLRSPSKCLNDDTTHVENNPQDISKSDSNMAGINISKKQQISNNEAESAVTATTKAGKASTLQKEEVDAGNEVERPGGDSKRTKNVTETENEVRKTRRASKMVKQETNIEHGAKGSIRVARMTKKEIETEKEVKRTGRVSRKSKEKIETEAEVTESRRVAGVAKNYTENEIKITSSNSRKRVQETDTKSDTKGALGSPVTAKEGTKTEHEATKTDRVTRTSKQVNGTEFEAKKTRKSSVMAKQETNAENNVRRVSNMKKQSSNTEGGGERTTRFSLKAKQEVTTENGHQNRASRMAKEKTDPESCIKRPEIVSRLASQEPETEIKRTRKGTRKAQENTEVENEVKKSARISKITKQENDTEHEVKRSVRVSRSSNRRIDFEIEIKSSGKVSRLKERETDVGDEEISTGIVRGLRTAEKNIGSGDKIKSRRATGMSEHDFDTENGSARRKRASKRANQMTDTDVELKRSTRLSKREKQKTDKEKQVNDNIATSLKGTLRMNENEYGKKPHSCGPDLQMSAVPQNLTRNTHQISPKSTRSERSSRRGRSPSPSQEEALWSPSQRQAAASKRLRVMFTSFKDPRDEKIVKEAGGVFVESAANCSVLVTSAIRRTCKLLACIGKGIPVVSVAWLEATKKAGSFVDPSGYIIHDKDSEKKFGFSLKKSLEGAAREPLYAGYSIYVTDSVKPSPDQMKEIIECAGGHYLEMPPKLNASSVVVVSCEEDKKTWNAFRKLKIPVVSPEFILTGLLRQKVLLEENRLA